MKSTLLCNAVHRQVNAYLANKVRPDVEVATHIKQCELCQHHYADIALERLLQCYEVEPPQSQFVDRVIARASNQPQIMPAQPRRAWFNAVAASVAAAVVITATLIGSYSLSSRHTVPSAEISLLPQQIKTVRLLIDSIDDRENALITIELADNLELDGYSDKRIIEWETHLMQGKNLLALPLRLKNATNSYFNVAFSDGDTRKQIRVDVLVHQNSPTV